MKVPKQPMLEDHKHHSHSETHHLLFGHQKKVPIAWTDIKHYNINPVKKVLEIKELQHILWKKCISCKMEGDRTGMQVQPALIM